MADSKITALTALTAADPVNDMFPVVDVSDTTMAASGTTKRISVNNILGASGTATLASATITGDLTVSTAARFNGGATAGYLNGSLLFGSGGNIVNFYAQSSGFAFKDSSGAFNLLTAATTGFVFGDGVGGTRMTLNSTGLGVGVVPSLYKFEVGSGSTDTRALFTSNNAFSIGVKNGANQLGGWIGSAGNNILTFSGNDGTMKVTIDASGNLLVGTTTALASGNTFQNLGINRQVLTLKGDTAVSYTSGIWNASTTGDALFQYFATETSLTVRGGISYNRAGGLVAYNTTSDYRAKDIIGSVSNSGSLIDSLKVYVGKMKGATIERPMLIAHEAQEVAPYAVTGLKDEIDADGKDKYQQMDVSSFVPLLIAEIQSLRARVQTLEAR